MIDKKAGFSHMIEANMARVSKWRTKRFLVGSDVKEEAGPA